MEKIKIITNIPEEDINEKSMNSRSTLSSLAKKLKYKTLEFDSDILSEEIATLYSNFAKSIKKINVADEIIKIENIQFTVGIDSKGGVAIMSTLSGENQTSTGITFTISFKE